MQYILLFFLLVYNTYASTCDKNLNGKTVSTITLESLTVTKRSVVMRELIHKSEDIFSCDKWDIERQNLMDLDIFADVLLNTSVDNDTLNLIYTFKELPPYLLLPTIGKTDQDGWRAGGILASLNFLGRDIRLEAYARYGFKPDFASVAEYMFIISSPYLWQLPLEYELAYIKTERFNTIEHFNEDSHLMQAEFFYPLWNKFKLLFGGRWLYMQSDTTSVMATGRLYETVMQGHIGLSFDTRNKRFNPFKGHYTEIRLTQTSGTDSEELVSTEYLFDHRQFIQLSTHNLLRLYGLAEYRHGEISRYNYYHGGGVNTLAGYQNTAFAGISELLLTAEYAYELFHHKSFSLFGFNFFLGLQCIVGMDYGLFHLDGHNDHGYSYYTGIHLLIPGAERLRFELSQNLTAFAIDFNIGFFEKSTTRRWRVR